LELQKAKTVYDEQVDSLRQHYITNNETLKSQNEKSIAQAMQQKDEALIRAATELSAMKDEWDSEKKSLLETIQQKEVSLQTELTKMKTMYEEKLLREEKLRKGMQVVEKQGWLIKKGNSYGKLQERWFVLRGEYLLYFKDSQKLSHPAGAIYLVNAIITAVDTKDPGGDKLKFPFEIRTTEEERVYLIGAPNDELRKEWIEIMRYSKGLYFVRIKEQKGGGIGTPNSPRTLLLSSQQQQQQPPPPQ